MLQTETQQKAGNPVLDLVESGFSQLPVQHLWVIAPIVTRSTVPCAEPVLKCGHTKNHPPTRKEMADPTRECGGIILNVLEHLEGTHHVKPLLPGELACRNRQESTAGGLDAVSGYLSGSVVRLHTGVVVVPGEAGADGALSCPDLEYPRTRRDHTEGMPNGVVAQPSIEG